MKNIPRLATILLAVVVLSCSLQAAPRHMEKLGRGVVAVHQGKGDVFVSWRLLGTEPPDIGFNVYRTVEGAAPVKLNSSPLTGPTHFIDKGANFTKPVAYTVRAVVGGAEQEASAPFKVAANAPAQPYLSVPLQTPQGYLPNDASVGDLDGDGEYEIVLHQGGKMHDNSHAGETDPPILQAYKLDGELLWTINLGKNIRDGAHYTQFMVYDLDGDGKAEVACKTADGTTDGKGKVIGDAKADHRSQNGYILKGPEFLTVFDGMTGAELATTKYIPPRHPRKENPTSDELKELWGDGYGNRFDRFLACVAYLDGVRPSLVMCRGYYSRTVLAAWDWRDGKLTTRWVFDSHEGPEKNKKFAGQGNHNLSVADVDGDGKDEIVYGGCTIDDDGKGLYSTGLGHGDAMHVTDHDPTRPGLEVFRIQEPFSDAGAHMLDAKTGEILWKKPSVSAGADKEGPGRGLAMDIDPRYPGSEAWVFGAGISGLFDAKGNKISDKTPASCNFGVWWDGDLLREMMQGTWIGKWDWNTSSIQRLLTAEGCGANNGTKSTPCLSADILGDWREEVIWRSSDAKELRIYTTTIPTDFRLTTLMHDPEYRLAIAWQNVAYNQPPHTDFFLGQGMAKPPRPNITVALAAKGTQEQAPRLASVPVDTGTQASATQDRIKAAVDRRRAEDARGKIPELKGMPRALLIVKGADGRPQLVRANAAGLMGNVVVAELAAGGKGVWQREFISQQLPWPSSAEIASGAVNAVPLLARYEAVATAYPELKLALNAEAAPIKLAIAALQERKAKLAARFAALVATKYNPDQDYKVEELESFLSEAEIASLDQPEKSAEIASITAPFRQHLEKLAAGQQRVGGVWRTAEELQLDTFVKDLQERRIGALVLTRAQLFGAIKVPLIGASVVLLAGIVLTLRKSSRVKGIVLLVVTLGGVAVSAYAVTLGEPPPRRAVETGGEGATKVARAVFLGASSAGSASEESGIKLTAQELNEFAGTILKIEAPNPSATDDLQRTGLFTKLERGRILLFEQVRLGGTASTIRYALKPLSGDKPQIRVESVQIGSMPATGTLSTLLWKSLSSELTKSLSPGINEVSLSKVESGALELVARSADGATSSPQQQASVTGY